MCPLGTGYNYFLACDTAERIIFAVVAGSGSGKLCWHSRGNDNDQENAGYVRESAGGSEQVLRLRAQAGAFRAPARVTFFFCKKKVTKENHSNLRFKDPLARCGLCKIGGADLAELVRWGSLSVRGLLVPLAPLPLVRCEGRGGCAGGVGDYQIAPIAARSTAMGRWRLTPPWYGDAACGRKLGRFVPRHEYLSFFVKRKLPKKTTQTYGLRIPWRGDKQVLRLRAQAAFFSCRKKAAKERHLRKGGFRISPFP